MPDTGNAAQTRIIAEQVAEAAVIKFAAEHPEIRKDSGFSNFQKLLATTVASLMAIALVWIMSTLNSMQVTVARLDERIASGGVKDARVDDLERRVTSLEGYHKQGGGQ